VGHIVVFEGSDRVPGYHRCEELADAVSFVEKLRNDRGVDKVNIYRTEEVRFDFKPYYRVELGALGAGSTPTPLGAAPIAPAAPHMAPPPPITAMAMPSASGPSATGPSATGPSATGPNAPSDNGNFDSSAYDDEDDLSVGSGVRRGLFGR
jgi:hypothetical protein